MNIAVQLQPFDDEQGSRRDVEYRWDPDTEILSAQLAPRADAAGSSDSVGVEGRDGSWLILDVAAGAISGVEVAVWPEIRTRASLAPPTRIEEARVSLVPRSEKARARSLEIEVPLVAEADGEQRTIHFRLGRGRDGCGRTIRLGRDLLLDVDEKSQISGLWLLNVPPCPSES